MNENDLNTLMQGDKDNLNMPGYNENTPPQQPEYHQGAFATPVTQMGPGASLPFSSRNRYVAGILGILFGVLGVHNFYLGKYGIAVTQLLLTILSFGIFTIFTAPWSLVEAILIFMAEPGTKYSYDGEGFIMQK